MLFCLEWESHEPGYFSVALFDHRTYKSGRAFSDIDVPSQTCPYATGWKHASEYECSKINDARLRYCLVCTLITQIYVSKRIPPVVALSADCQESTKQLCLSAGMNAFFSKPLRRGASCVGTTFLALTSVL